MFVRAVRRPARPQAIRHGVLGEQIRLSREAYPAYSLYRRGHRWLTLDGQASSLAPRKRRNSNDGPNVTSRRTFGMDSLSASMNSDDIPFVRGNEITSWNYGTSPLSHIRPHIDGPLRVPNHALDPPQRLRMNAHGTGGDLQEIVAIYRACLHVGRMERAALLMKRFPHFDDLTPEHILGLQNEYLRAAVTQIVWNDNLATAQALHKWFNTEIRARSLPVDASTIGYMLKASLRTSDEDARDGYVQRYMAIGTETNLQAEILDLPIWTAEELHQITQICPEFDVEVIGFEAEEHDPEISADLQQQTTATIPTPEVRQMEQKGLGLKALKQSLELFNSTEISKLKTLTESEKRSLQVQLETHAVNASVERWREENANLAKMGLNTALQTKSLAARMWRWQLDLQQAIKLELDRVDESEEKKVKSNEDAERCTYGPFLRIISLEKLAAVTILSTMTNVSARDASKGVPLSAAILSIASDIEDEALLESVERLDRAGPWSKSKKAEKMTAAHLRRAKRSAQSDNTHQTSNNPLNAILAEEMWPPTIKAKVGAVLLSALIETAKIPVTLDHHETKENVTQMQSAFYHSHQFKAGKRIGTIIPHAVLTAQLKREPVHSLLAKHLPMLAKPDPWSNFGKGGFLSQPAKVMRIKLGDKEQRHYAEAAISKGDMEQTFKGLDVLGKTPWMINQRVFDIMLEAWNTGEAIANICAEKPHFDFPPEPVLSEDPLERGRWVRAVKAIENARSGQHSQRCFQNFQLEIARSLKNEVFYFPHNVDFRGRAYPIPPYLNHMGADHCRGLLMFGFGKELGESGLRWLKIHLANVFGYDKASLKEREAFAGKHLDQIYESASNPLEGSRWWLTAEDPWQFLAAAIELKNALESPDPTKYVSNLPVHQDGTCNGLQHYAALGGDELGAKQVNLEPGDRPADVYSAVANMVRQSIDSDRENGDEYAKALEGRITRKIVKQTVMTNVYGVTWVGAKAQVRKALTAAYDDLPNTATVHPGVLSSYIATKIFAALASMFRGAHDIQYWLGECASRISTCVTPEQMNRWELDIQGTPGTKARSAIHSSKFLDDSSEFKTGVIWTNPLHMPVVQPYRNTKVKQIATKMQRISISEPHTSHPIHKRKQLQGFPPNFIHSLDATHMILSALQSDEQGLAFAAVHDSFWTHAADIDSMNTILRDSFIRIHSDNVIGRLAAELEARYKGCIFLAKVRYGTLLYDKITAFRKQRNKKRGKVSRVSELLEERERCRLLASSDPEQVEKGQRMQTAASLYEEFSGESDLAPDSELADIGLGEIPNSTCIVEGDSNGNTLLESESALDVNALEIDVLEDEVTPFENTLLKQSSTKNMHTTWLWLPMKFPAVPKKVRFFLI